MATDWTAKALEAAARAFADAEGLKLGRWRSRCVQH